MINKETYKRFTERDEFDNADIIGVDTQTLCEKLSYEELNRTTRALNCFADLEDKIQNGEIIFTPKYKLKQKVYWVFDKDTYWKGQIDGFDIFTQKYLVYIEKYFGDNDDIGFGNTWCSEEELFATSKQAKAKLNELKGE